MQLFVFALLAVGAFSARLSGRVGGRDIRRPVGDVGHRTHPVPVVAAPSTSSPNPEPPVYPASYYVKMTFSIPYIGQKVQKKAMAQPTEVWLDVENRRQRIEYYDGMDTYLWRYDVDLAFEIIPQKDKLVCQEFVPGDGPTLASLARGPVPPFSGHSGEEMRYAALTMPGFSFPKHRRALRERHAAALAGLADDDDDDDGLTHFLPDLSTWAFNGTANLNRVSVNVWNFEEKDFDKVNHYKFYAKSDGTPVRLEMLGYNFVYGSHYDLYIFDYERYQPGAPPADVFDYPDHCKKIAPPLEAGQTERRLPTGLIRTAMTMGSMLPRPKTHRGLHAEYDSFIGGTGRRFSSRLEYHLRSRVYLENKDLVEANNRDHESTMTLGLNKWADWTEYEFQAFLLPSNFRPGGTPGDAVASRFPDLNLATYDGGVDKRKKPDGEEFQPALPAIVDWRGTGAVSPVKDQAACGSCWAFGITSAAESAYYLQTGRGVSLSEQQLVDCAWDTGNAGCDGGLQDMGLVYAMILSKAGGLELENTYPYLGQDAYCTEKKSSDNIAIKGLGYVKPWSQDALKSALYFKGPVSVSIDANPPAFRFYTGGVYKGSDCGNRPEDLDHAVTAVGYGTDSKGSIYWVIKNSWSTYWGDEGYINISSDDNTCGVMTQPVYAEVMV